MHASVIFDHTSAPLDSKYWTAGWQARASLHTPGWRVLPYGNVVAFAPRHARSHSASLHSRLPARVHAAAAAFSSMYACGTTPGADTARTGSVVGCAYGEKPRGPLAVSSTSAASQRSTQKLVTRVMPAGQPPIPG